MNKLNIFSSVKSQAINDLSPDLLDTALDQITDSEILKDIPIFGLGFKSYSLYQKITEGFFVKKLLKFLYQVKDISMDERQRFIEELEAKEESKKAGERLLNTLNRLDDDEKAEIIGRLFKQAILSKIEIEDFNRLSHIIDNSYISDIRLLKDNPHLSYIENDVKSNLNQVGLLSVSVSDIAEHQAFLDRVGSGSKAVPKLEYKPNKYCQLLIKFGFE